MLFYRFKSTETAVAGAWSVKLSSGLPTPARPSDRTFQPMLTRQIIARANTDTTTFNLTLTDWEGVVLNKWAVGAADGGVVNDFTPIPIQSDLTLSVDSSSANEDYTVLVILSDEKGYIMAFSAEGKLSTLADATIDGGTITIDEITSNNRPIHVGEVSNVSDSTLTTVTTMPANGVKYITKVMCSGFVSGKWDIYIDSVRKATLRTIDRNVVFDFNLPMKVLAAEVVDIKVTHYDTGNQADFQATMFGYLET